MSQVKKLQNGGNYELVGGYDPNKLSTVKLEPIKPVTTNNANSGNYGSLTIDGIRYEATPEMINNLSSFLGVYGATSAPLAGLTHALQNGRDVVYDSVGNTISGMDGLWAGIDEKANEKRYAPTSNFKKRWQATIHSDPDQFRRALSLLSGYRYVSDSKNNSNTNSPTNIYGKRT